MWWWGGSPMGGWWWIFPFMGLIRMLFFMVSRFVGGGKKQGHSLFFCPLPAAASHGETIVTVRTDNSVCSS